MITIASLWWPCLWYHLGLKFSQPRYYYWSTWTLPELRLSGQSSTPCPASPSGACVGVIAAEIWLTQPCKNQNLKKKQSVILSLFTLQCPAFHEELPTRQDKAGLCPSGPCGAQPCLIVFRIKKIPLGFHFSWKIEFSPLVRALAKMLEAHHTTQIHHALMIKRNSEVRATVVHT